MEIFSNSNSRRQFLRALSGGAASMLAFRLFPDEAAAFESDVTAVVGKLQPEGDPWAS